MILLQVIPANVKEYDEFDSIGSSTLVHGLKSNSNAGLQIYKVGSLLKFSLVNIWIKTAKMAGHRDCQFSSWETLNSIGLIAYTKFKAYTRTWERERERETLTQKIDEP